MVFPMPSFLSRLARPFTASSQLGISETTTNGASAAAVARTNPPGSEVATVSAGCFWGVEHVYRKHFGSKGLYDARVGYTGGHRSSPDYHEVCTETTGHAESLQIVYDPTKVSYRALIEFFYRIHDPTTLNRQGMDIGGRYRSAIFYHNEEQERIANEVTKLVNENWYEGKVTTKIVEAGQWWDAEEYHQLYLDKNPSGYQCPTHFVRSFPKLK